MKANFAELLYAHTIRERAEGIRSLQANKHPDRAQWLASNPLDGFIVKLHEDAEQAALIIRTLET